MKVRRRSEHLIDVLADLHAVDIDAVGLGDLAKREGYVERQVKRWSTQWEKSQDPRAAGHRRGGPAPARARIPVQQGVSIAHGDFRFGNCLTDVRAGSHRRRARLGAVHARRSARRRRLPRRVLERRRRDHVRANDPTPAGGFPHLRRPARALRGRTGRDLSRHRLLRGVLLLAARGHQRGRLRPLPARRDGRPGGSTSTRSKWAPRASPSGPSRQCRRLA